MTDLALDTITADQAIKYLWDMLQEEDGTPMSVEANMLIDVISEDQKRARNQLKIALRNLAGMQFERDLLAQKVEEIATDANRKARNDLVNIIASQQNLSEDTVRLILDYLAGEGDWGINGYAQRILDRAITEAGAEIEDFIGISSYKVEVSDDSDL